MKVSVDSKHRKTPQSHLRVAIHAGDHGACWLSSWHWHDASTLRKDSLPLSYDLLAEHSQC
eukprot:4472149-Amphidinium_carterae.1